MWPDNFYLLSAVRVYDGPGVLSPLVVPSCNASAEYCTCYLSSYKGFLKYRILAPSNFKDGYIDTSHVNDVLRQQGILWEGKTVLKNSADCVQQGDSIHFHSKSGICWGQTFHSLINIHSVDFHGYNMLDRGDPCTYGGLFIFWLTNEVIPSYNRDFITICLSTQSEIVLPYRVHTPSERVVIVFKTFKGYSDGSVHLTISWDPDCIGWNYITDINAQCSGHAWTIWKDHRNKTTMTPKCSDFWLLHDGIRTPSPSVLECCILKFDPIETRRTIGSFRFMVSGVVVYRNFTSFISSYETSFFNMTIEADTVRDFPFNLSTEKSIFSMNIPTTSTKTFFLNPVDNFLFKLNYMAKFREFILVINIQIVENVICTSVEDHHPPRYHPIVYLKQHHF